MIVNDTPIIPWVVADMVINKIAVYISERSECTKCDECDCPGCRLYSQKDKLIDFLVAKANIIYEKNVNFAKLIRSNNNKGLEALCSFMSHWLVAELKRNYSVIFHLLPRNYGSLGAR